MSLEDTLVSTPAEAAPVAAADRSDRLTLAHGLMMLIAGAAAVLRLTELGRLPLGAAESAAALGGWLRLSAESAPGAAPAPLYANATAVLFALIDHSDGWARLVPALAGTALVLLPWFIRSILGTAGALAAAALLAMSPLLAATARLAGGDALALLAVGLMAIWLLRAREAAQPADPRWLAAIVGIGATTSPLFYTGAFSLALLWLVYRRLDAKEAPTWNSVQPQSMVAVFGVTFLLCATFGMWQPAGLGEAAALLPLWLQRFTLSAPAMWLRPPLLLVSYESAFWLFGLPAFAWAMWRRDPFAIGMLLWFLLILPLALLQAPTRENIAIALLPIALAAGRWLDAILLRQPRWTVGLAGGLTALIAFASLTNVGRYTRWAAYDATYIVNLITILLVILIALPFLVYLAADHTQDLWAGIALGLLAWSAFFGWGQGWRLSHIDANDPRTLWADSGTHDAVRLLQADLREASLQTVRTANELAVVVEIDTPLLRWYLREFEEATFNTRVVAGNSPAAAITATSEPLPSGARYARYEYPLTVSDTSPQFDAGGALPILRWWLFGDRTATLESETVTLWIRR